MRTFKAMRLIRLFVFFFTVGLFLPALANACSPGKHERIFAESTHPEKRSEQQEFSSNDPLHTLALAGFGQKNSVSFLKQNRAVSAFVHCAGATVPPAIAGSDYETFNASLSLSFPRHLFICVLRC
jgi:hypothetical protein